MDFSARRSSSKFRTIIVHSVADHCPILAVHRPILADHWPRRGRSSPEIGRGSATVGPIVSRSWSMLRRRSAKEHPLTRKRIDMTAVALASCRRWSPAPRHHGGSPIRDRPPQDFVWQRSEYLEPATAPSGPLRPHSRHERRRLRLASWSRRSTPQATFCMQSSSSGSTLDWPTRA